MAWGDHAGQILEHKILIRSWPDQEVFIAQQAVPAKEPKGLDETSQYSRDIELLEQMSEVRRLIWEARKEIKYYNGLWRAPSAAEEYNYRESWLFFGLKLDIAPLPRLPGDEVLFFLSLFDNKNEKPSFLEMQDFLRGTPTEEELSELFDWACEEDGRVVLEPGDKLTNESRDRAPAEAPKLPLSRRHDH